MTIRFTQPSDPRKLPESVLWRMTKDGHVLECRTRIVPLGDGAPELRFLIRRADGTIDLLWSGIMIDSRDVTEFAQMKLRDFEGHGWTLDV